MQRAMHPELFTPRTSGSLSDPVAVMESVQRAYPDSRVSGVEAPTTARPTYLAYAASGDRCVTLLLDPVSAQLLGEVPEQSFVRTLQDLHFDLLGGSRGRLVNGVGALGLLGMCVTGLVIWWPGVATWRRGFAVDLRRSWKRVAWEFHSAVGIWTVTLISMWALTGVHFAFPSPFRSAVNAISPLTVAVTPMSNPTGAAFAVRPSWGELIARAQQRIPDLHVQRVVTPSSATGAFLVMFSRDRPGPADEHLTSVYLDQYTGDVLNKSPRAARSAGDIVMDWVAPLHVGSFGGTGVRVAWLILGLAPPLLFVTGFIMWWSRVVRLRLISTSSERSS